MYKQLITALIVGLTMTLAACNNGGDDDSMIRPAITGPATLANGIVGTASAPATITATGQRRSPSP